MTGTLVGTDANQSNSTAVTVVISGSALAGDLAYIAAPYNPTLGTPSISGGGGAWAATEVTWSSSFHSILYRRTLTAGDIGATITVGNTGSQKLAAALGVLRGVTGEDDAVSSLGVSIVTSRTAPSFTAGATDVALAFWTERESVPSTSITSAPSGFTLQDSAFNTGSGATCVAVASNMTPVTAGGTVGGGNWVESTANDAVVMFIVGATVDPAVNATASLAATATVTATASVTRSATAALAATATVLAAADPIPAGVWRGGDAQQFNGTSVSVTIPSTVKAGDIGLIAHPYAPNVVGGVDPTTPTGWTQIDTQTFGASFHARLYAKTLALADASTTVTFTNGSQKLSAALAVIGGCSGIDVQNFTIESSIVTPHPAPSVTAVTSDVAVAFITERESTPSTAFTAPAGFTLRNSAFNVGGGATCVGVASNLTAVAPTGTVGGGNWVADVANDALVMWVVGLTIAPVQNASASRASTATITATASTVRSATASLAATATISATATSSIGPAAAGLTATATTFADADVIAGTGPVVTVQEEPRPRSFRIEVYDENINKLGRVGQYITCDLLLKHLEVGSWGLLLNLSEPAAELLQAPGRRITVDFEEPEADGSRIRLLSGPVDSSEVIVDGYGQRTVAFAGYDDKWWLDQRVAYQSPEMTFPSLGVSFAQPDYVDIRAGSGEAVAKAFVTANAVTRFPVPHLTVAPNLGRGSSVSYNARMHSLLWMVTVSTSGSGLGFRVDQVGSNLVFDVYDPEDKPVRLSTKLGNLQAYKVKQLSPAASFVVGGGTGENTARRYMQKSLPASAVGWGHREKYLDVTDATTDVDLSLRITENLFLGEPTAGFSLTPRDTRAMRFGRDYNVGDRVIVELESGLEVTDTVREVKLSHTSADGMSIVPGIGYSQSTDPTAAIYRSYRALRDEVANMKRSV